MLPVLGLLKRDKRVYVQLLAREFNADNTRTCAVWLDDMHRRLDSK